MDVDPGNVHTLSELVRAFQQLRHGQSYAALSRAARVALKLAAGLDPLPSSTLSDLFNGRSVPSRETTLTLLAACGLEDDEARAPWLAAWERVSTAHLAVPAGAVRVREARPRLLGVHAAIRVDDASAELPAYVPRDLDADLRTAVTAAAECGGFVLLVGGSSVGKTRAMIEVARAVASEWWLIHPADAEAVCAFAQAPTLRTVIWLDELQRYLDHQKGLPVAVVRGLVSAGTVVLATLWPHEYGARTVPPQPGQADPHANDRELLRLAQVIDVPDAFSETERTRARSLATDRRIRIALDTPDSGFTQVLAGGPELVRWWENASDPYGKAVITAALDARRVGAYGPLSRELLCAAAVGYLTPALRATAPPGWLDQALGYAATELKGTAATLRAVGAGIGVVTGYTVADYLYQHARLARENVKLPAQAWQALVKYRHPDDTLRLADCALNEGRDSDAEALYRSSTDLYAADRLADLLAKQGRVDDLYPLAEAGGRAALRLADLLTAQGRIDEALLVVRRRADVGDMSAAGQLVELLIEQGRVDELRHLADASAPYAADGLADLLAKQNRVDELRELANAGDRHAALRLADLLIDRACVDEALVVLHPFADAGDLDAVTRYADLLADQGRLDAALAVLHRFADTDDPYVAKRYADLLAGQGDVEEALAVLRRLAERDDMSGAEWLADLLADQGRVDDLGQYAAAGDPYAVTRLADLLIAQNRTDEALVVLRQLTDGT